MGLLERVENLELSVSVIERLGVFAIAFQNPPHLAAQASFVLDWQVPEVLMDGLGEENRHRGASGLQNSHGALEVLRWFRHTRIMPLEG